MKGGRLGPCTLAGQVVLLEPLRKEHAKGLFEVASSLDWGWFLKPLHTMEDVEDRIAAGLYAEEKGEAYAFAVSTRKDSRIVGSTSYLQVAPDHMKAEIGSTWYANDVQGTKVNPECKYLLLRHAFEEWGAVRVQFVTDSKNVHSQRAIAKLGAELEGTLRSDRIRPDGTLRDSVVYSILAGEWPSVKRGLMARI